MSPFCRAERRAERRANSSLGRINKLVSPYSQDGQDEAELTAAVQEQCQQANGFILVIDAAKLDKEGT